MVLSPFFPKHPRTCQALRPVKNPSLFFLYQYSSLSKALPRYTGSLSGWSCGPSFVLEKGSRKWPGSFLTTTFPMSHLRKLPQEILWGAIRLDWKGCFYDWIVGPALYLSLFLTLERRYLLLHPHRVELEPEVGSLFPQVPTSLPTL